MSSIFPHIRAFPVVLALAVTICSGQEQPVAGRDAPSTPAARVFSEKRKVPGVPNFGQVTPTLFRGAQPSQKGFEVLAKMGVGIVVDARGERADDEGKEVVGLGMRYVAIPWQCPFPHDDVFVRFLKLLQENPEKKVFVHCRQGVDRTGMMIASYRMANQGWSADEAMLEMRQFGFSSTHRFLCPRLASYEQNFPTRLKRNLEFNDLH